MSLLLAGDIGGTKTLLSLWRSGPDRLELLLEERFVSAAWPDLVGGGWQRLSWDGSWFGQPVAGTLVEKLVLGAVGALKLEICLG